MQIVKTREVKNLNLSTRKKMHVHDNRIKILLCNSHRVSKLIIKKHAVSTPILRSVLSLKSVQTILGP